MAEACCPAPFLHKVITPSFRAETMLCAGVPVVRYAFKALQEDDWASFESVYRDTYTRYPCFIVVFDTRKLTLQTLPSMAIVQRLITLVMSLKSRTVRQVALVAVLTRLTFIKELVVKVVHMGGQAAPFLVTTAPAELCARVAAAAVTRSGGIPHGEATVPPTRTLDSFGRTASVVAALLHCVMFIGHIQKEAMAKKKR